MATDLNNGETIKKEKKNRKQRENLRTPKGTLDLSPKEAIIKKRLEQICRKNFERHNGIPIETPMFELRENLIGKYGEDTKLIFNLEDQGGDICSLRYDLTVPFSRFLSKGKISRIRKYQIGSVFRRDNPSKGRLREFSQADFDFCGTNIAMSYDAEMLSMISEILLEITNTFDLGEFVLKVNDRRIINGYLELANIKEELKMDICSTIDKMNKLSENEIKKEMEEKGLKSDQIDFLYRKVMNKKFGFLETIEYLKKLLVSEKLSKMNINDQNAVPNQFINTNSLSEFETACDEFLLLFDYCNAFGVKVELDLTLARGLSYYTGLIVEGSFIDAEVGSICGGGRYDNLCKSISDFSVPCVGFSIGVTRIMLAILAKEDKREFDWGYQVFVGSAYGVMLEERMRILKEVQQEFNAETMTGERMKFKSQLDYAYKNSFKVCLFTGETEKKEGKLIFYDLIRDERREILRSELMEELRNYFNKPE
ncbi:histidine--tRNA [Nucleospora cyclopteri]